MKSLFIGLALAGLVTAMSLSASGQETDGHAGHEMNGADASPSTRAFTEANDTMHRDMAIAFSGDADIDFARAMIPHHQGAIDMAKVVLEYGDDPELQAVAEAIIVAQEKEIAFMRDWLSRNGAE